MKIGVISDTHGLLRPEVLAVLASCDHILHAGDINDAETLERLRSIAPLHVVRGNNDGEWAAALPILLNFSMEGLHFLMVHNRNALPKDLGASDVIVFGHSHTYFEQKIDGRLWLNPGSCGGRRFKLEVSLATLSIRHGHITVQKIAIL